MSRGKCSREGVEVFEDGRSTLSSTNSQTNKTMHQLKTSSLSHAIQLSKQL
jgi:hypothetical protein